MTRLRHVAMVAGLAGLAVAGQGGSARADDDVSIGRRITNFLVFGSGTRPTGGGGAADEVECPPVTVAEGKAAIRNGTGDAVRSQLSISDVAQECTARPDGSVVVKVGVDGRLLLGAGGSASRSDAPVFFVLKRGDRVLASRARRVPVSIAAGDVQGSFTVVEDGMVVPPKTGEFEIEVGLGTASGAAPALSRYGDKRPV